MEYIWPNFRSLQKRYESTHLVSHFSQWTEAGVSRACFFCHFRCLSWEETDCILALPTSLHWLKGRPRQLACLWNNIRTNEIPFPDSHNRIPLPDAPTTQSIISEENYFCGWLIVRGHLNNWSPANWFQKQPCTVHSQETWSELPGCFTCASRHITSDFRRFLSYLGLVLAHCPVCGLLFT